MGMTYAATGLTQTDIAVTGNTTSAITASNSTTLTFTALGGVSAGQVVAAPAAAAGCVVTASSATSVTLDRGVRAAIPSGTTVTFEDADGILTGSTGLTINDVGTGQFRQRSVNLTGTSVAMTISGTFNIDANRNSYNLPNAGIAGFSITGGTLNISGTDTGYRTGNALSTGTKGVTVSAQAASAETFSAPLTINLGGTVNMNGVSWYSNAPWNAGQVNQGSTSGTFNISNSLIRLGNSVNGLSTIYNASNNNQKVTFNFTNVLFNGYMKLLAVNPASKFVNVTWFKDVPSAPQYSSSDIAILLGPYTSGTTTPNTSNDGITLIGPKFGFAGNMGSYFNTHIGVGNVSSRVEGRIAIRNAIYGYERGVIPLVGKAFDFGEDSGTHRPWYEFRKNLQLTVRNSLGAVITSGVNTYFEDQQRQVGALVIANIDAPGSGYTNGTFTSTQIAQVNSSNTATVTIVVSGGAVMSSTISTPGERYFTPLLFITAATPLVLAVNQTTFPGVGNGTGASIGLFAANRYSGEANSGCPTVTSNRTYAASVNVEGVMSTTVTNSGNGVTYSGSGNPTQPSGVALKGIDLMWGIANRSFLQPKYSYGLTPVDMRFSSDNNPNYVVSVPIRGYLYNDDTYTLSADNLTEAELLAQTVQDTKFLTTDVYVAATGVTQATASGYSDVTLVTPAPTRGALLAGDTQGALVRSTSGTLTTGETSRSLDQLYAKAKFDYVQPILDATSTGLAARTGFGISQFLSPSGAVNDAVLSVTNWDISVGAGVLTAGSVFKSIVTSGVVTKFLGQSDSPDGAPGVVASRITLGDSGVPASWRTNSRIGSGTGQTTFTATLPSGSPITTDTVNISGVVATDIPLIQAALQASANSADLLVSVAHMSGTPASVTISLIGSTKNGAGNITFAPTNSNFSAVFAKSSTGMTDALTVLLGLSTPAGWSKGTVSGLAGFVSSCSVTYTATVGGPKFSGTVGAAQIVSTTGNFFSSGASANSDSYQVSATDGVSGNSVLSSTFTSALPASGGVTPTSALTLTSSLATYLVSTSPADNLISSVAGVFGKTVCQSFTVSGVLAGLVNKGTVLDTGGSILSGGPDSTYSIKQGGSIATNDANLLFRSGTDTILSKNINSTGGPRTLTIQGMKLYQGDLNVTTDTNYTVLLNNTNVGTGLTINGIGGTVNVIYTGLTGPITAGANVNLRVGSTIVLGGLPSTVTTASQIKAVFLNAAGTSYRTDLGPIVGTPSNGSVSIQISQAPGQTYKAVFWVDGCYPVVTNGTIDISTSLNLSVNTIPTNSIQFSSSLSNADTDVISRTSVQYTEVNNLKTVTVNLPASNFVANPDIGTSTLQYSQPSSALWRLVLWRILSGNSAANIAFQNALASGALPNQFIQWNTSGYTVQNNTVATPLVEVTVQKVDSNTSTQVVVNCYVDDLAGLRLLGFALYAKATNSTDDGKSVNHMLNPTQSVVLSPADQLALAAYAVTGIKPSLDPINKNAITAGIGYTNYEPLP